MSLSNKDLGKPNDFSIRITRTGEDVDKSENPSALYRLAGGAAFFLKAVGLGLFLLLASRACSAG